MNVAVEQISPPVHFSSNRNSSRFEQTDISLECTTPDDARLSSAAHYRDSSSPCFGTDNSLGCSTDVSLPSVVTVDKISPPVYCPPNRNPSPFGRTDIPSELSSAANYRDSLSPYSFGCLTDVSSQSAGSELSPGQLNQAEDDAIQNKSFCPSTFWEDGVFLRRKRDLDRYNNSAFSEPKDLFEGRDKKKGKMNKDEESDDLLLAPMPLPEMAENHFVLTERDIICKNRTLASSKTHEGNLYYRAILAKRRAEYQKEKE